MHHCGLLATGVALLAALPSVQAGMYTKTSPVLQVDAKSYERLIAKSNHTSVRCVSDISVHVAGQAPLTNNATDR